jgi:phage tail protein X
MALAAGSMAADAARCEVVDMEQPFVLHAGESREVRPPGMGVTLRSLDEDSGCLSPDDCSAMLFRGSLVLRLGARTELHTLDALLTPENPFHLDFADFALELSTVRPDASGVLAATFRLLEANQGKAAYGDATPPAGKAAIALPDIPSPPQAIHTAIRVVSRDGPAFEPIWIERDSSSLSNAGWTLIFRTAEPLRRLEVMTDAYPDWTVAQGEGRFFHTGVGFLDGETMVQVRGLAADGRMLGPYRLTFDALDAVREQDMRTLRSMPATWVQFNDHAVYFGSVFSSSCGVREVRYSINSHALDKRLRIPPCSLLEHGRSPSDPHCDEPDHIPGHCDILLLKHTPDYIAVQLLYADGSESPVSVARKGLH